MDFAPVAQLDRVADFESEGCRFESCRARFCNPFFIYISPVANAYRLNRLIWPQSADLHDIR
jgi:hypothetical protein